jgi:hypothetical protein
LAPDEQDGGLGIGRNQECHGSAPCLWPIHLRRGAGGKGGPKALDELG